VEILRESEIMGTRKIDDDRGMPIPAGGTLGLLALGYRGLEAWRDARGRDWVEQRRVEWEAGKAAEAKRKAEKEAAAANEAGDAARPEKDTPI
jgi:hypothetical protein